MSQSTGRTATPRNRSRQPDASQQSTHQSTGNRNVRQQHTQYPENTYEVEVDVYPRTKPSPRKEGKTPWHLQEPEDVSKVNETLGHPGFFPLTPSHQEDKLDYKSLLQGYKEEYVVKKNDHGTLKSDFQIPSKIKILQDGVMETLNRIIWLKNSKRKASNRLSSYHSTQGLFPRFEQNNKEEFMRALASSEKRLATFQSIPQGFSEKMILDLIIDYRVPLLRATWFIKVYFLNKCYSTSGILNDKSKNGSPSYKWTVALADYFFAKLKSCFLSSPVQKSVKNRKPVFTAKLTENKPAEFIDKDKQRFSILYLLKLLNWHYKENLLDKSILFSKMLEGLRSFLISGSTTTVSSGVTGISTSSTSIQPSTLPLPTHADSIVLSLVIQHLSEIATSPNRVNRLLDYCKTILIRLSDIDLSTAPTEHKLTYTRVCHILRSLLVVTPDTFVLIEDGLFDRVEKSVLNSGFQDTRFENYVLHSTLTDVQNSRALLRSFVKPQGTPYTNFVETLDGIMSDPKRDLITIYTKLFTQLSWDNDQERQLQKSISLLCEWAVTPHSRFPHHAAPYVASSLLRMHMKNVNAQGFCQEKSLQDYLTTFLDEYNPQSDEAVERTAILFGEFIRCGLFSHDQYVRDLIARGLVERRGIPPSHQLAVKHMTYLRSFPIDEESEHERRQRLVVLQLSDSTSESNFMAYGYELMDEFLDTGLLENPDKEILRIKLSFKIVNIINFLKNISVYYRVSFTEYFVTKLRKKILLSHGNTFKIDREKLANTGDFIEPILLILHSISDFRLITNILIMMLRYGQGVDMVVLDYVKKYEFIFFCQQSITSLLEVLHDKYSCDLLLSTFAGVSLEVMTDYLARLYQRHDHLAATKQWVQRIKKMDPKLQSRLQLLSTPFARKAASIEVKSSPQKSLRELIDNQLQKITIPIPKTSTEIHELHTCVDSLSTTIRTDATAVFYLLRAMREICYSSSDVRNQQLVFSKFLSAFKTESSLFIDSHTPAAILHIIKSDITESFRQIIASTDDVSSEKKLTILFSQLVLHIVNNLVQYHVLLSEVLHPMLQKALVSVQENMAYIPLYLRLIRILVFDTEVHHQLNILEDHELKLVSSMLELTPMQYFVPILEFVNKLSTIQFSSFPSTSTSSVLISRIQEILRDLTFKDTCLMKSCIADTQSLYEWMKSLRDPSGCRMIYHKLLRGNPSVAPVNNKDDNRYGVQSILDLLRKTNVWTVMLTGLEIRILMDEWHYKISKSINNAVVDLIFYRMAQPDVSADGNFNEDALLRYLQNRKSQNTAIDPNTTAANIAPTTASKLLANTSTQNSKFFKPENYPLALTKAKEKREVQCDVFRRLVSLISLEKLVVHYASQLLTTPQLLAGEQDLRESIINHAETSWSISRSSPQPLLTPTPPSDSVSSPSTPSPVPLTPNNSSVHNFRSNGMSTTSHHDISSANSLFPPDCLELCNLVEKSFSMALQTERAMEDAEFLSFKLEFLKAIKSQFTTIGTELDNLAVLNARSSQESLALQRRRDYIFVQLSFRLHLVGALLPFLRNKITETVCGELCLSLFALLGKHQLQTHKQDLWALCLHILATLLTLDDPLFASSSLISNSTIITPTTTTPTSSQLLSPPTSNLSKHSTVINTAVASIKKKLQENHDKISFIDSSFAYRFDQALAIPLTSPTSSSSISTTGSSASSSVSSGSAFPTTPNSNFTNFDDFQPTTPTTPNSSLYPSSGNFYSSSTHVSTLLSVGGGANISLQNYDPWLMLEEYSSSQLITSAKLEPLSSLLAGSDFTMTYANLYTPPSPSTPQEFPESPPSKPTTTTTSITTTTTVTTTTLSTTTISVYSPPADSFTTGSLLMDGSSSWRGSDEKPGSQSSQSSSSSIPQAVRTARPSSSSSVVPSSHASSSSHTLQVPTATRSTSTQTSHRQKSPPPSSSSSNIPTAHRTVKPTSSSSTSSSQHTSAGNSSQSQTTQPPQSRVRSQEKSQSSSTHQPSHSHTTSSSTSLPQSSSHSYPHQSHPQSSHVPPTSHSSHSHSSQPQSTPSSSRVPPPRPQRGSAPPPRPPKSGQAPSYPTSSSSSAPVYQPRSQSQIPSSRDMNYNSNAPMYAPQESSDSSAGKRKRTDTQPHGHQQQHQQEPPIKKQKTGRPK